MIFSTNSQYLNRAFGGAETSLRLIAEKFASVGDKVVYLTGSLSKAPSFRVKEIDGVKVCFFSPLKWPSATSGPLFDLKKKFASYQFQFIIKRIAQREGIQVVHTYNEYPNTYDALQARARYGLGYKVVIRIAGLWFRQTCSREPQAKPKVEWTLNNVDLMSYISPGIRELFLKEAERSGMKLCNKNEIVLDIGFNSEVFNERWKLREHSPFRIVMVGRLMKRQDLLIRAMSSMGGNGIQLHLVGDGPNKENLMQEAARLGLGERVIFHGTIPQNKVRDLLLRSHLFCMATDYEGLCKSVIEAMAMGIPVLASNVSALNTYIEDDVNGFLCDNLPEAWARRISEIHSRHCHLEEISRNEIAFVSRHYDPDLNILQYREAFEELIS